MLQATFSLIFILHLYLQVPPANLLKREANTVLYIQYNTVERSQYKRDQENLLYEWTSAHITLDFLNHSECSEMEIGVKTEHNISDKNGTHSTRPCRLRIKQIPDQNYCSIKSSKAEVVDWQAMDDS